MNSQQLPASTLPGLLAIPISCEKLGHTSGETRKAPKLSYESATIENALAYPSGAMLLRLRQVYPKAKIGKLLQVN